MLVISNKHPLSHIFTLSFPFENYQLSRGGTGDLTVTGYRQGGTETLWLLPESRTQLAYKLEEKVLMSLFTESRLWLLTDSEASAASSQFD